MFLYRWTDTKRHKKAKATKLFFVFILLLTNGCGQNANEPKIDARWYTQSQIDSGRSVFKENCAVCHGEKGGGTAIWRLRLADNPYTPLPLNGAAHTQIHPLVDLRRTIDSGVSEENQMPPFKDKLTEDDIDSVIAFFQSEWTEEIYTAWLKRGGL